MILGNPVTPGNGVGTYQSVLLPLNTLLLVGIGVRVALDGASVTTEQAVQSRANLVTATGLDSVALSAPGLEEVGTLLRVTWRLPLALIWELLLRFTAMCNRSWLGGGGLEAGWRQTNDTCL